ncbi:LytR/AlgR family response regulator transcription factor [Chitinophaga rhizophila]|uniref:LytTR family DNA-binding domain-containing protein n=1 Tax=Chitinophaga rhizophila TaxID=2866212 RepID=A0ABS7GCX7_9BACT|nr:LytTR family DNA-binding domain-containing protein [Chitinophaga rhizophila]MBW8684659.1 LytTR family DNA-binding domain-containing protein [Chitinophaga rhizophila]
MNVIIIEDERRTASELKSMLENLDQEIRVISILPSVASAVTWFRENKHPDLIFSDIQLGDGLSFDVFKEIQITAPVIFCTAFDQYAVHAFESNSIDYLLKPIEEGMLERSIQKYHRIREHFSAVTYATGLSRALNQLDASYKQSILVYYREKIVPVRVDSIAFVYTSNGIVRLHTIDHQDYTVQYTIEQLEEMLNPRFFFKANRQFIINRNIVKDIEHYFNRRLVVKTSCDTPEKVVISRLKAQDFLRWVEQ